jgi:hypothetical protein
MENVNFTIGKIQPDPINSALKNIENGFPKTVPGSAPVKEEGKVKEPFASIIFGSQTKSAPVENVPTVPSVPKNVR